MLRTNSKKAKNNIRNWIIENFESEFSVVPELEKYEKYNTHVVDTIYTNGLENVDLFSVYVPAIYETFFVECLKYNNRYNAGRETEQEAFIYWLSGLPGVIHTEDYILRPNAKTILADLLEETPEERDKYTETDAEKFLSYLIFREVKNEMNRQYKAMSK